MKTINRDQVTPFITKDNSVIREILALRNSSILNQSLAEARVAPGQTTQGHYHIRTEEYYMLQGRGRMWIEEECTDVKAADGIAILPGNRHKIENLGSAELVFRCCCSPTYTHEDTMVT